MKRKNWKIKKPDKNAALLARRYDFSVIFAQVLLNRGIEDISSFLNPALESLHDPFLLPDMQPAVSRLEKALRQGEKVLIAGDYDVDGVTSLAIFYEYGREFSHQIYFYIPHRVQDGYGLNIQAVDQARDFGASLIVAFDCGTNSYQEINYAASLNIDVIVIDHHLPQDDFRAPFAFVNPKRKDSRYPFRELSAGALSFKFLQALTGRDCFDVLDLVALSVVCDVVPLQGENRIMLREGLNILRRSQRPAIRALCRAARIRQESINSFHLGYILGPRINAAGRVAHANEALGLFLSPQEEEAYNLALRLCEYNQLRKGIETDILKEAENFIDSGSIDPAIIVGGDNWHPGVLGIVASRLADKYCRPAFVISFEKNLGKGSARSIHGLHLVDSLGKCADLLSAWGGHSKAAGLEIHKDNLDIFRDKMNYFVREKLTPDDFTPLLDIDAKINFNDINLKLVDDLESLQPYGEDNPRVLFAVFGVDKKPGHSKIKRYYSFWFSQGGVTYEGLIYNKDFLPLLDYGSSFDLVFSLEKNIYHNTPRLIIKDLRLACGHG